MNSKRIATITLATLLAAACTKPAPTPTDATTAPAAGGSVETPAATPVQAPVVSPVALYNAYTSSSLTAEGVAGEPGKSFKTSDKIYVGAVVHGQAASSKIKVEWSVEGAAAPSSGETAIPVTGASVATVELTKTAPLAVGKYKALVYLDGAPAWELAFDVAQQ